MIINLTYGKFAQIHTGHLDLIHFMSVVPHDELVIASNYKLHLKNFKKLINSIKFKTITGNSIFNIVSEIIRNNNNEDLVINFFVGEDRIKFANRLVNFFSNDIKINVFINERKERSSTKVRQIKKECNNMAEFIERVIKEKLAVNRRHGKIMWHSC